MSNVSNLYEKSDDNRSWNLEQMLQKTLDDVLLGKLKHSAAVLIMLSEDGNGYSVCHRIVNLKSSEVVALLEITKNDTIQSMGVG